MDKYIVTGMSCAACQARVEKAVSAVPGVESCAVSLLTNSMGVTGTAKEADIIKAVTEVGYGARKDGGNTVNTSSLEESLKDTETPKLKKRLIYSVVFLAVLMYISMGHMMWGFPVPAFLEGNHMGLSIIMLLLAAIIMVINQKFFISGITGLIHKSPNMDTLVALGSGASFIWSVIVLIMMTVHPENSHELMMDLYFESAAMILALITVGKMLEARSKGKTTDALKSLMKLTPDTATVLIDDKEVTVPVTDVKPGDIFTVRPGESIPVDGTVLDGESAVNESALTGESIPVDKTAGSKVSAATINESGYLKCRADKVGEDTAISKIIQMVSDAAATKAPIAKIADRVSGVFVPAVIGISLLTLIVWLLIGKEFGYSLARAISVLVISCPCALGLATPVSIMVGNGMGAKNGILFKTSQALEETGKTQIVALDKTGTITKGEPEVTDIIPCSANEDELVKYAYTIEKKSEHPLSRAIVRYAEDKITDIPEVTSFRSVFGKGITGEVDGKVLEAGNLSFIGKSVNVPDDIKEKADMLAGEGKTPLYFRYDSSLLGVIAVADVIKPDSVEAVKQLKKLGIHTVMITGDLKKTAEAIGKLAGVDEVVSEVLPDEKEKIVSLLMEHGKTAMVGDGINDAPALTKADTGIAIGAGTDVAIDAADVVLVKSSIMDVAKAVRLSRATLVNIKENLFWAFIYNVICIPLAAGLYIKPFGLTLNPMIGALCMSLSSFCVVSNALRLNLFKVSENKKDKPVKNMIDYDIIKEQFRKGEKEMNVVLNVEGMMCPHCEARVNKAVSGMEGVVNAVADHNTNSVTVTLDKDITEENFKAVIEACGYEFKGMSK